MLRTILCAGALLITCLSPLAAQNAEEAQFDIILRGIKAGQLIIRGREENGFYTAAGRVQSTGIVGAVVKFRYDAQTSGALRGGTYSPARYREEAITKRGIRSTVMTYKNGTPVSRERRPVQDAGPYDLPLSAQKGTVDILTALYAVLRDRRTKGICTDRYEMFDGRKRTRLTLSNPKPQGDGSITCTGEYRRVDGFSPSDMAERTRFAFTLTLKPNGDLMQVTEVRTPSTYGDAILKRR